jgi:hypothetical protein
MLEVAVEPIRTCGKQKRTSCYFCFKGLFGKTEQMGLILAKTFDGEHRWIPSGNIQIDAMFFSATSEKLDDDNPEAAYKDRETFILCNPNAMYYQHMINFPHAFYLRYFLQKGCNVLVWNYRGYGLTKATSFLYSHQNMPTPSNIKQDAEAVLSYLRNKIGVRGKVGVYGRSLGGIATTHLTKYVDMVLVDRSFGNLHEVIDRKFFGYLAVQLVKFVSGGTWSGTNDLDFITTVRDTKYGCSSQPCYKVLCQDKNDDIVDIHASLAV